MVQILEHQAGRLDRNGHQVEHSCYEILLPFMTAADMTKQILQLNRRTEHTQGHQKEQEKDLKERSVDHLGL